MDLLSKEPVRVNYSAGKGQLEKIYKTLARVDAESPVVSFTKTFGEEFLNGDQSMQTIIVSPNFYEDFMELVAQFTQQKKDLVWFYPTWDFEEPEIQEWLKPYVKVLHLRA